MPFYRFIMSDIVPCKGNVRKGYGNHLILLEPLETQFMTLHLLDFDTIINSFLLSIYNDLETNFQQYPAITFPVNLKFR